MAFRGPLSRSVALGDTPIPIVGSWPTAVTFLGTAHCQGNAPPTASLWLMPGCCGHGKAQPPGLTAGQLKGPALLALPVGPASLAAILQKPLPSRGPPLPCRCTCGAPGRLMHRALCGQSPSPGSVVFCLHRSNVPSISLEGGQPLLPPRGPLGHSHTLNDLLGLVCLWVIDASPVPPPRVLFGSRPHPAPGLGWSQTCGRQPSPRWPC